MVLLDAITFLILLSLAVKHIMRILRTGKPMSVGLLYIVMFVAYGLPTLANYIAPVHYTIYSFAAAMEDPAVHLRYNLVLLTGVFFLWITSINGPASDVKKLTWGTVEIRMIRMQIFSWFAWLVLFLPIIILIVLVPDRSLYLIYGSATVRGVFFSAAQSRAHFIMGFAIRFAFAAYFLLRIYEYYKKGHSWTWLSLFATVIMCVNVYLEGKRSMVGLFVFGIGFLHILHGGKKKVFIIAIILFLVFSALYNIFGKENINPKEAWRAFLRGDTARDYTLYYTVAHSKLTENSIMPRRGNSFIWIATAYIPRRILTSKGWTTSQYFTASVFGRDVVEFVMEYRWGYGTGFFEEFLLNFGYLGLLLFIPLGFLLRILDRLIYRRSFIYCIIWLPLIYNVMFATDASLRTYVTQVIPILFVSSLIFKTKMQEGQMQYQNQEFYKNQDEYEDANFLTLRV